MEVVTDSGIDFELARLWRVESWEESRDLERRLKHRHESPSLCPLCRGLPVDDLVFMRQGHWPFSNFAQRARPRHIMGTHHPMFVHRVGDLLLTRTKENFTWHNS